MKKLFLALVLIGLTSTYAQNIDDYVQLLRSDLKMEKTALISEVMHFTEQESKEFWPVYREYELKLEKLGDERLENIKSFAKNFDNMNDEKADELIKNAFDFHEKKLELEKDLYNDVKKITGAAKAAKLIQLEHQINTLIDLKIGSELPLLEKTAKEEKDK
jgi:hypothetical protein